MRPTTMKPITTVLALTAGVLMMATVAQPKPLGQGADQHFESKVRPILLDSCIACHGPNQQLGNLRLDRAITTDQAAKVIATVKYDGTIKMPPSGKLADGPRETLVAWGKAGAPWPKAAAKPAAPSAKFWAFQLPKLPAAPAVRTKSWGTSPIDRFVLAKLEPSGLKPAPAADKRTLLRRATFDLTGLPPTPAEVDAFLKDTKPGAFERVIDRLLASPAYGERWGRHWLDVARYADSNGVDENLVYINAWRYRDYVVSAINADKPINRFFHEQLAGDLMPDAGRDGIIATGYLSLGPKMLAEDDPVKQELDIIDEQVDTLGKTFMGMTFGCARCHDHKFDPIPTKDYYSLAGIFKSTKTMLNFQNMAEWQERPLVSADVEEKLKRINAEIKDLQRKRNQVRDTAGDALLARELPRKELYFDVAKRLVAAEVKTAALMPVIGTPDGAAPQGAMLVEAEDFTDGNVIKDKGGFGQGIGVLVNAGQYPNRTSYTVKVNAAGPYQLDVRSASGDPRPCRLYINDVLVSGTLAGKVSGGFNPQHQQWYAEGVFNLNAGENRIRFERDSYFPHIDKFLILHRPGQDVTASLGQLAGAAGLVPELVGQVAERVRAGRDLDLELPDKAETLFPEATRSELTSLMSRIDALTKERPAAELAMAVSEGKPTTLKVHLRGNYQTLGDDCARRFPDALAGVDQTPLPKEQSGRLQLAEWLTSPRNPLTARVFVNRVWRWRFGRGIVASVDNFGILGDKPTHPELLDYLAVSFVREDKWSLKALHKRMMLTSTYQMSGQFDKAAAAKDPDNKLLWRFPRKRLEAEAIRDSILAVTGLLDRTVGGSLLNFGTRQYVTSTANADPVKYDSRRRALYLPVVRSAVYDVYTAFDFGDPTVMNGDRPTTTVAPQALFMLNSSIMLTSTRTLAGRLLTDTAAPIHVKVRRLYEVFYGRPATDTEVVLAEAYLEQFEGIYAKDANPKLSAWQSLCKALIAANEFVYVD